MPHFIYIFCLFIMALSGFSKASNASIQTQKSLHSSCSNDLTEIAIENPDVDFSRAEKDMYCECLNDNTPVTNDKRFLINQYKIAQQQRMLDNGKIAEQYIGRIKETIEHLDQKYSAAERAERAQKLKPVKDKCMAHMKNDIDAYVAEKEQAKIDKAERWKISRTLKTLYENNDYEGLRGFVQAGGDIDHIIEKDQNVTLLHHAIRFKDVEMANFLLSLGADPDILFQNAYSAYVIADKLEVTEIKALLEDKAHYKTVQEPMTEERATQMMLEAAANDDVKLAKKALDTKLFNPTEAELVYLLSITVGQDSYDMAEFLLSLGADPRLEPKHHTNESVLDLAIQHRKTKFVELFGGDVSKIDYDRLTPLEERHVMREMASLTMHYRKAIAVFEDQHGTLPGDVQSTELLTFPNEGNGNGMIEAFEEDNAWSHLNIARLNKDSNVPEIKIADFGLKLTSAEIDGQKQNILEWTTLSPDQKGIDQLYSARLDKVIDDGAPDTGTVRSFNVSSSSKCIGADQQYTKSDKTAKCKTIILLSR